MLPQEIIEGKTTFILINSLWYMHCALLTLMSFALQQVISYDMVKVTNDLTNIVSFLYFAVYSVVCVLYTVI